MKVLNKLALLCALSVPAAIHAEDIEVYVGNSAAMGAKPKVLFILDNSGSMNETVTAAIPYDPAQTYEGIGSSNAFDEGYIFYSVGIPLDDIPLTDLETRADAKRFEMLLNGCDAAKEALAEYGFYTGKMLEFSKAGNGGSWENLKNDNGGNMNSAVDCLDDFRNNDSDNEFENPTASLPQYLQVKSGQVYSSQGDDELEGFPSNANVSSHNPFLGYSGSSPSDYSREQMEAEFEQARIVTLYTPNYVRWHINKSVNTTEEQKIEVARETIRSTLGATQEADFALMLYNLNYPAENDRDGGRIVAGFGGGDENIVDIVRSIEAQTATPLCETLFEAYNYFAGNPVLFGDDDTDCNSATDRNSAFDDCEILDYTGNSPSYDSSIVTDVDGTQTYITPFTYRGDCPSNISIIYITDGLPVRDEAANEAIARLDGMTLTSDEFGDLVVDESYLPALAHWMHKNDINTNVGGIQSATLYTVGFGDGAPEAILEKAAQAGGGRYYFADDGESLEDAIQETLNTILATSTSFTAPSVASNNFDRTQTSDSVYYAMFLPTEGARWAGNLKKLKVSQGNVVDKNGAPALDTNGNIKSGNGIATTFWSAAPDGGDVRAGGANYVLSQLSAGNRNVYSNFVDYGVSLTIPEASLTASNVNKFYGSEEVAAGKLGVPATEITDLINWARGFDVDDDDNDEQTNDTRQDIMGDPLHFRPVALTYPNDEIKILMGTNAGFLHLFSDKSNTLTEQWSFIPEELLGNLTTLRDNTTGEKVYGMDSTATVHFIDNNNNGIVDEGTDTVWAIMGMRRGGSSYYALDLSNSNAPRLLWKLDPTSPGFEELGQTWSQPVVTYLKGYTYDYVDAQGNRWQKPEPILVFGAGYDTGKDTGFEEDSVGRGVYMVKARDGSLVASFVPSGGTVDFAGRHGIVGELAMLDSNYDGLTDRMYASDTGGNVWRFDMPSADTSTWSVFKFAELSNAEIASEQRRFYYGPAVARTSYTQVTETTIGGQPVINRQESRFEAVLVGSGNRSHPLETVESNYLYMLRDENVRTQTFDGASNPVPAAIKPMHLNDVSSLPFEGLESGTPEFTQQEVTMSSYDGWMYKLSDTEKSLAQPAVLFGVAYFTSFTPSTKNDLAQCVLDGGNGLLYAFNLHYASTVYNSLTIDLGNKVPPSPTFVVEEEFYCLNCGTGSGEEYGGGENGEGLLKLIGIDENDPSKTTQPGFRTIQNYIYRLEDTQ
ncbi:pilus assembly protein [Pseudoalteromonas sp. T1lg75]|uniref:pilus assembly protein n=1 Tax=Pseudoalteromonas sp. T1lg75 TaxID=2077102 RepID=UPI000CF61C65|nr:PilC/PilY family type IV pilus protein [Pseudoalteromonas sp. T1lg75]